MLTNQGRVVLFRLSFVVLVLALLFSTFEVHSQEVSYDQWRAKVDAASRSYVRSLSRSIAKNVPEVKRVDPDAFKYRDPASQGAFVQNVIKAVQKDDEKAAVAGWVVLFERNNVDMAHAAGFEASPAVLREVARFFLPINRAERAEYTEGSFEYRLFDACVKATEVMMNRKLDASN